MNEIIFIVEESVEGGYEARALGESIFTDGETMEVLKQNIKEAIHCHFEENAPTPRSVSHRPRDGIKIRLAQVF